MALQRTLTFFQGLARPGGPAFEAALTEGWAAAGNSVGLRGHPKNPTNSLIQHSRMFVATSPTKETCLGLFVRSRPDYDEGALYLAPRCRTLHATFRLEMPAVFRDYRHCTDPLTDDGLTFLTAHLLDEDGGLRTRTFARVKDLWRPCSVRINQEQARALASRPAELAALGALQVTRAFDCSDIRYAPSPLARFILQNDGLEGAVAARNLGMNWLLAEEDPSVPLPGGIFSHGPL
jgi:hypothetical protein